MKVICIHHGHRVSPDNEPYVKEGDIYTVVNQFIYYSQIAQKKIEVYEFLELDGWFDCCMFIPLSDFDENLMALLRTKPKRNNK